MDQTEIQNEQVDEEQESRSVAADIDQKGEPPAVQVDTENLAKTNGAEAADTTAADQASSTIGVQEGVEAQAGVEPPRKRLKKSSESEHDTSSEDEDETLAMPADYTYENGTYAYTDPSGQKLLWDADTNSWVAKESKNYIFDGETYLYKDESGKAYKFNQTENSWDQVDDEVYEIATKASQKPETPEAGSTYRDPDGTVFEWDVEKGAWFPKIDDDFLAKYQMSYGVTEDEKEAVGEAEPEAVPAPKPKELEKKAPKPPTWFEVDDAHNTKVYVSNLPLEMTEEEFVTLMSRYGLIAKELNSSKWKMRMYKDEEGRFKGDAICDYIKIESVNLALQLLDGSVIDGKTVHVERAKFQMKGEYDPTKKPKKKKKKDLEIMKKKQEKLLEWKPDALRGERPKHESVVVIKRLFKPEDIDKNPELLLQLQNLLRKECSKFGLVRRVDVHDRHPDGAAQVYFKDADSADDCVMYMHGRWLNESKISVETWDGKTKYKIKESEEDRKARLAKWEQFLEKGGEKE